LIKAAFRLELGLDLFRDGHHPALPWWVLDRLDTIASIRPLCIAGTSFRMKPACGQREKGFGVSTITSSVPTTTPDDRASSPALIVAQGGEQRTVFRGVDWHTYDQLCQATGESGGIRLTYDGKDLEIMVVGYPDEIIKELLGAIVRAVATGLDLDSLPCGQTTWQTKIRGLEADLSYYFDPDKIRAAREGFARMSMDPADYPRPDLAIEIDMSPPQVDRSSIYRDLGVAEVWRLVKGQELIIEQLQADGSFAPVEVSRFLRVRPEDILRWLNEGANEAQPSWNRRLTQWAMGLGQQA